MKKRILASILVGLSPMIVLAQSVTYVSTWFTLIQSLLGKAVPLIISLAVVWFMWNVFQYAVAGDEEKKSTAKTQMIWGVVGIAVMVSIWGLIGLLQGTFGVGSVPAQNVSLPTFQ